MPQSVVGGSGSGRGSIERGGGSRYRRDRISLFGRIRVTTTSPRTTLNSVRDKRTPSPPTASVDRVLIKHRAHSPLHRPTAVAACHRNNNNNNNVLYIIEKWLIYSVRACKYNNFIRKGKARWPVVYIILYECCISITAACGLMSVSVCVSAASRRKRHHCAYILVIVFVSRPSKARPSSPRDALPSSMF